MSGFAIRGPNGGAFGANGANGATFHARGPQGAVGGTQVHNEDVDFDGSYAFALDENGEIDAAARQMHFDDGTVERGVYAMFEDDVYTRVAAGTNGDGNSYQRTVQATQGAVSANVQVTNADGEVIRSGTFGGSRP